MKTILSTINTIIINILFIEDYPIVIVPNLFLIEFLNFISHLH